MLRRFVKLSACAGMLVLLSFSSNSFAGDVYGKLGYGHHPFHIVIGYSGHNRHYGHRYHKHRKHYYVPRHHHHYRHHKHYYKHRGHYYNPPRRYCRSRY